MRKSTLKENDVVPPVKADFLNNLMNISKIRNAAIANGNDDIDTFNKAHKKAMKEMIAECPYCNPNWNDVPNFPEAMKGYDVPMGNPDPGIYIVHCTSNVKCN